MLVRCLTSCEGANVKLAPPGGNWGHCKWYSNIVLIGLSWRYRIVGRLPGEIQKGWRFRAPGRLALNVSPSWTRHIRSRTYGFDRTAVNVKMYAVRMASKRPENAERRIQSGPRVLQTARTDTCGSLPNSATSASILRRIPSALATLAHSTALQVVPCSVYTGKVKLTRQWDRHWWLMLWNVRNSTAGTAASPCSTSPRRRMMHCVI